MLEEQHVIKLASMSMPFGKYAGKTLIDLPETYLIWFANKGFPEGELGQLLGLCLEIKTQGVDGVVQGLKHRINNRQKI
jgi:uncharacterized protein (DUF3820 family)